MNAEAPTGRKLFRISRPSRPQERLRRPLALAETGDTSLEVQADIFWQKNKQNKTTTQKKHMVFVSKRAEFWTLFFSGAPGCSVGIQWVE